MAATKKGRIPSWLILAVVLLVLGAIALGVYFVVLPYFQQAPWITATSQAQRAVVGEEVTLFVEGTGLPEPTYQWQERQSRAEAWTNVVGATQNSYVFIATERDDQRQIRALLTNASGTIGSDIWTVIVTRPPTISEQPAASTGIDAGQLLTLALSAQGNPAPTFQWQSESDIVALAYLDIPNAVNATYTLKPVYSATPHRYRCIVSNAFGDVISAIATVVVAPLAPTITTQPPIDVQVMLGDQVQLDVTASANPAPTFQWQLCSVGGTAVFVDIPGATASTYSPGLVSATMQGNQYRVRVTNPGGSVDSLISTLTIRQPPSITQHPQSQLVPYGSSVTFACDTVGIPTPTLQWRMRLAAPGSPLTDIPGATGKTLTYLGNTLAASGAQFVVQASNSIGSVTSDVAVLVLTMTGPSIPTLIANSEPILLNSSVTWTATVDGNPTPSVQWQESSDGVTFSDVIGATNTSYSFTPTAAQQGHRFRLVASNAAGSVRRDVVNPLVLWIPATLVADLPDQLVTIGQSVTWTPSIRTDVYPMPTYQWQVLDPAVPGTYLDIPAPFGTVASFTTNVTPEKNAFQYRVQMTNAAGTITSNAATLTARQIPTITMQPMLPPGVILGQAATLQVTASGFPLPTYRWQTATASEPAVFNDIVGATSNSLSVTASLDKHGNAYQVVVSNAHGTVTSTVSILSVYTLPQLGPVINQMQSLNGIVTFTASLLFGGNPSPSLQWLRKLAGETVFSDVPGATALSYTTTATVDLHNAIFQLRAINAAGTVFSDTATFILGVAPTFDTDLPAVTNVSGNDLQLAVDVSGTPTPTLQWQSASAVTPTLFTDVIGQTGSTFASTIDVTQWYAWYRVRAQNQYDITYSTATEINLAQAPAIMQNVPDTLILDVDSTHSLSLLVDDTRATFQWYVMPVGASGAFQAIPDAQAATFALAAVQLADSGNTYKCIITNAHGTVESAHVTLVVYQPPVLSIDLASAYTVTVNDALLLSVTASATPEPTYQWQHKTSTDAQFVDLVGAEESSLSVDTALAGVIEYRVIVRNGATSDAFSSTTPSTTASVEVL